MGRQPPSAVARRWLIASRYATNFSRVQRLPVEGHRDIVWRRGTCVSGELFDVSTRTSLIESQVYGEAPRARDGARAQARRPRRGGCGATPERRAVSDARRNLEPAVQDAAARDIRARYSDTVRGVFGVRSGWRGSAHHGH